MVPVTTNQWLPCSPSIVLNLVHLEDPVVRHAGFRQEHLSEEKHRVVFFMAEIDSKYHMNNYDYSICIRNIYIYMYNYLYIYNVYIYGCTVGCITIFCIQYLYTIL